VCDWQGVLSALRAERDIDWDPVFAPVYEDDEDE
jgi:hypothetical protein